MIYLPIIGALVVSVITILEKLELKQKKINSNHLMVALFISAVVVMLPFLFFFGGITKEAFELKNIIIFALIVMFSILANFCYFYSMKWEKISNLEPVYLLEPLFTILLTSLLFTSERNTHIFIPALIASLALLFSHIKKHHLDFNKYILLGILGCIFTSFEIILSKIVLSYYSPLSLYFFRCLFILIFMAIIFRPNITKEIKGKERMMIFATGALWVVFRVLSYYGYIKLGVVFTTLILMLSPVFIYLFAFKFLKDKPTWRNMFAAIIILLSVLYALFF